jgi:aspartyl-tRNA(Asn)/glutamyl-tRNA(Gln) amidotransferase subunit C
MRVLPHPDSGLSSGEVEHVARLARLGLTPEEVTQYRDQLRGILAYIDQLNQADTSQVSATAHPLQERNVMRADDPTPCLPVEAALSNAPSTQDGYFKVKAIQE